MSISMQRFVPAEEIAKIAAGSYESLIAHLDEALQQERVKIFGEDVPARVVGTFDKHFVAANQSGQFRKIRFERSAAGTLKLVGHEVVEVKSYAPESIGDWVKVEALRVVDAFIVGGLSEGTERLRTLVPFVLKASPVEPRLIEGVVLTIKGDRTWKTLYRERAAHFKSFLGEAVAASPESPKYAKLYDGSIKVGELDNFRDLVNEDLTTLGTHLGNIAEDVEGAITALTLLASSVGKEETDALTALGSFAQDLLSDLRGIQKVTMESSSKISSVSGLAEIHDALVGELHLFETASRFIIAMTKNLVDAGQK